MILDERELCLKLQEYRENIHAMMSDLYDLELTLEDWGQGAFCQASCSIANIALDVTAEYIDEILEEMGVEE